VAWWGVSAGRMRWTSGRSSAHGRTSARKSQEALDRSLAPLEPTIGGRQPAAEQCVPVVIAPRRINPRIRLMIPLEGRTPVDPDGIEPSRSRPLDWSSAPKWALTPDSHGLGRPTQSPRCQAFPWRSRRLSPPVRLSGVRCPARSRISPGHTNVDSFFPSRCVSSNWICPTRAGGYSPCLIHPHVR
jgi:hypothetical protein